MSIGDSLGMMEQAVVGRRGVVRRRTFLKALGAGAAGGAFGFTDLLQASAPALRKEGKSVIVLWMQGGPAQFECFDPKAGSDGCMTKTIQTAMPGLQIADYWPNLAKQMQDVAVIRSMTNKEGNHQRATYQLHTGYLPSGTLKHPGLGSIVASEIAPKAFDLPGFVSILGPSQNQGFLPASVAPFRVTSPSQMPANSVAQVKPDRFGRRVALMESLEHDYAAAGAGRQVKDHHELYEAARRMVLSPKIKAFDLDEEGETTKKQYGSSPFGQGCLLARRLVEAGVTFVEVQLGNWDTHDNAADRIKTLAGQCDPAYAALLADLKQRGLLDSTLVVWMGEFGRTPKVNPRGGRDHYPKAFSVAVSGLGLKTGQVIGKTDDRGSDVASRPVAVADLFNTFCQQLKINPKKENQTPVGRPIKLVDGGAPVKELLS